jgi:hypothetical protein
MAPKNRFSPSDAYWNQREKLASLSTRILELSTAIDQQSDMLPYQWAQLIATVLEFRPQVIIELGRGRGNSTAAFTQAANILREEGTPCTVISLCLSSDWDALSLPRVKKVVPKNWFHPLKALMANITCFDYDSVLKNAQSCLLFWDAHGFEVAECVLGDILPKMAHMPHLVLMHDLSDTRYQSKNAHKYGENSLWMGNNWSGPRLRIGIIDSAVEQSIAAFDFTTRNEIPFDSADHSFHDAFDKNPDKNKEMMSLLGDKLYSTQGHWFWFTMNDAEGELTFPKYTPRISDEIPALAQNGNSGKGIMAKFSDLVKGR